ncbi:MAG: hypothetical protein COA73_12100 [Candidatus Hydrogenedentota bacterium]|nr:MAG: hypothetical protein COA73_12100 [Candidatus Hydrogenedentota bacterium]
MGNSVYQTFNKKTGNPHPCWKFYYVDFRGKRKYVTGTTSYDDTKKLADVLEAEHREMRLGLRAAPAQNRVTARFSAVRDEYLEWGAIQGGHKNYPWGKDHLRMKKIQLRYFEEKLRLKQLGDLLGTLPKVEKIVREMLSKGKSGKTVNNYTEALVSFCNWCIKREYLPNDNPLKHLQRVSHEVINVRRAMTLEEISKLFAVCKPDRKFLYLVALTTGLRASELASLRARHIDFKNGGINLEAKNVKNRKATFIQLPESILKQFELRVDSCNPEKHLLFVPKDTARAFHADLIRSEIPKKTDEGVLVFACLRNTFITMLVEAGGNPKECQTLARHSCIQLTFGVYARARSDRLLELTESVTNAIVSNDQNG